MLGDKYIDIKPLIFLIEVQSILCNKIVIVDMKYG